MDSPSLRRFILALIVSLLTGCALSPDQPAAARQSAALALQQDQRAAALASTVSGRRVWFAGFAMNSTSKAFPGDLALVERRLAGLGQPLLSHTFSNELQTEELQRPFATPRTFTETMQRIGGQRRPDDLVVVLVSTHGAKGLLSVNAARQDHRPFTSAEFREALKPLGDVPTVILLSACHAGSFIPTLQSDNRIILAAASADRSSFGCDYDSSNTWFIDALFGRHFDASMSIGQLMERAKVMLSAREALKKYRPSQPQIWIGPHARALAERPVRDWWVR
jgi:hypothetical protein